MGAVKKESGLAGEIARQPELWIEAGRLAESVPLPWHGEHVAIVGCGSSGYVARCAAALREASGAGETDSYVPGDFPVGRAYDAVIAISRSGTTTEVVSLLDSLPPGLDSYALTIVPGSPVGKAAKKAVVLDFVKEESVVQTGSATSVVALFRVLAGHDIEAAALVARRAHAMGAPVCVDLVERHVFLGSSWYFGLAEEAALKLREAAGAWAEAYPDAEYLHGPRSASDTATMCWAVGPVSESVLAAAAGAGNVVVPSLGDPMADLVRAQLAAVHIAAGRGRDPANPPWLSYSVILD